MNPSGVSIFLTRTFASNLTTTPQFLHFAQIYFELVDSIPLILIIPWTSNLIRPFLMRILNSFGRIVHHRGSFVVGRGLLQDSLHHCVAKRGGFRETWSKVLCDILETVTVGLEITEGNTLRPCLVQTAD